MAGAKCYDANCVYDIDKTQALHLIKVNRAVATDEDVTQKKEQGAHNPAPKPKKKRKSK